MIHRKLTVELEATIPYIKFFEFYNFTGKHEYFPVNNLHITTFVTFRKETE